MTMGVRVSLRASRLIPRSSEIYRRALTSVTMKGLELVTFGEQIQDLTTELSLRIEQKIDLNRSIQCCHMILCQTT